MLTLSAALSFAPGHVLRAAASPSAFLSHASPLAIPRVPHAAGCVHTLLCFLLVIFGIAQAQFALHVGWFLLRLNLWLWTVISYIELHVQVWMCHIRSVWFCMLLPQCGQLLLQGAACVEEDMFCLWWQAGLLMIDDG